MNRGMDGLFGVYIVRGYGDEEFTFRFHQEITHSLI